MKKKLILSIILVFAIRAISFAQDMPSTESVMKNAYAQNIKR
jgi:hypothetical protein